MTIETEDRPPIYLPAAGSVTYRVLQFLKANPDEELTRSDIATKFDAAAASIDTLLSIAVARGAIKKGRNSEAQLVWKLGDTSMFRLSNSLVDARPAAAVSAAPAPAPTLAAPASEKPAPKSAPMPFEIEIQKATPLPLIGPAPSEITIRYDQWFGRFEVGDSALFDVKHLRAVVARSSRYANASPVPKRFRAVKVSETQGGIVREA